MNLKQVYTKRISLLLIISILSLNLSFLTIPKEAGAQSVLGTGMTVTDVWYTTNGIQAAAYYNAAVPIQTFSQTSTSFSNILAGVWHTLGKYGFENMLAAIAKKIALVLVQQITDATVNWINSGFNGNPAYVADITKFLSGPGGVADSVIGQFFQGSELAFLCDPFKIQVSLALQASYGLGGYQKLGCTFSAIANNAYNAGNGATANINVNGNNVLIGQTATGKLSLNGQAVSDFTAQGGWDAWLKTTLQPQNNPVGAYLIAKEKLDSAIIDAKGNKINLLSFGQGALTFSKCKDTYYTAKGELIKTSEEYTEGKQQPNLDTQTQLRNQDYITKTKCSVKTPGTTVSSMLNQKYNIETMIPGMQAALGNGIDSIIGALLGALTKLVISKVRGGALDQSDSPEQQNFNFVMANASNQIQNTYNNQVNGINNGSLYNPSQLVYDPEASSTYVSYNPSTTFNPYDPSTYSTSTPYNPYNPVSTPPPYTPYIPYSTSTPSVTGGGYNGGYTGNTALSYAKNNSMTLINYYLKSELAYQNTYLTAQNVLTAGKNVFSSSSACNLSYNRNDYVLRSLLIRSNVITNIDGVADSNRTIASIPWNFKVSTAALENSSMHVAILNKATTDVSGAQSTTAITDAMITVNSTSFNIDPQAKMVGNIKTWLRGVRDAYNSLFCPIDLTKVLQITTATSTPTSL